MTVRSRTGGLPTTCEVAPLTTGPRRRYRLPLGDQFGMEWTRADDENIRGVDRSRGYFKFGMILIIS